MSAVVTGAYGFIGQHLVKRLIQLDTKVAPIGLRHTAEYFRAALSTADTVYHLAGVNRPQTDVEFESGNVNPVLSLCARLKELGRTPEIVMTSSVHAVLDTPYGLSKRHAEQALLRVYPEARILRLKNVFGKGSRPYYNGVVATFCYNISHCIPIQVSSPDRALELVYVDDVISALIDPAIIIPSVSIMLGELADRIRSFQGKFDIQSQFDQRLYATYLSYI